MDHCLGEFMGTMVLVCWESNVLIPIIAPLIGADIASSNPYFSILTFVPCRQSNGFPLKPRLRRLWLKGH